MDLGLGGRAALVAGASTDIGKAVAVELAREGYRIVLCAPGEEGLRRIVEDVERLVAEAGSRFGPVEILANDAGGIGSPLAFEEFSEEWLDVPDLKVVSAVRLARATFCRA